MATGPADFVPLNAAAAGEDALTFVFRGDELLLCAADGSLPGTALCAALGASHADMYPVGLLAGRYHHSTWVAPETAAPPGFLFQRLRALFGAEDARFAAIAGRAYQIAEWARTHRFCGACGHRTAPLSGEHCMQCMQCGLRSYPRISPAMMVLILRGERILLAKPVGSTTGRFSALAGFLEAGESVEDAVHREVFEEVGLRVRDLRYFGSQSWPFPHSLMVAFTAQYASGDIRPDPREIAEARWFGPGDAMPEVPGTVSIAGTLIRAHCPWL